MAWIEWELHHYLKWCKSKLVVAVVDGTGIYVYPLFLKMPCTVNCFIFKERHLKHTLHFPQFHLINKVFYCNLLKPPGVYENHSCLKQLFWLCHSEVPSMAILFWLESTVMDQGGILLLFWLFFFCCSIITCYSQDISHSRRQWSQRITGIGFSQLFPLKLFFNREGVTQMPVLITDIVLFCLKMLTLLFVSNFTFCFSCTSHYLLLRVTLTKLQATALETMTSNAKARSKVRVSEKIEGLF